MKKIKHTQETFMFIFKFSNMGIFMQNFSNSNLEIFNTMRTLRAIRPLKALSRFDGIKVEIF
jgi:hypothetical protein